VEKTKLAPNYLFFEQTLILLKKKHSEQDYGKSGVVDDDQ